LGDQELGFGTSAAAVTGQEPLSAEVRNRFDGSWGGGFEVVETLLDNDGRARVRIRRLSDGHVLPALFEPGDVLVAGLGGPPPPPQTDT